MEQLSRMPRFPTDAGRAAYESSFQVERREAARDAYYGGVASGLDTNSRFLEPAEASREEKGEVAAVEAGADAAFCKTEREGKFFIGETDVFGSHPNGFGKRRSVRGIREIVRDQRYTSVREMTKR